MEQPKHSPATHAPGTAGAGQLTQEAKLALLREQLSPAAELLVIGCAGARAQDYAGWAKHVRVIDESDALLTRARQQAEAADLRNVTFERAFGGRARVPEASLDAVYAPGSVHRTAGWQGLVRHIHRILKPGGVFVSDTACLGDEMAWFAVLAAVGRAVRLVPNVQVFTRAKLTRVMADAGLQVERCWQSSENGGVFVIARKPG